MSRALDTLAARIKFARERAQLTQKQLAELSGMRQPDISKIELGAIQKTTGIARLAMALRVESEWLELGNGAMDAKATASTTEPETAQDFPAFSRAGHGHLAHEVSQRQTIVLPEVTKVWEDLVIDDVKGWFNMTIAGDELAPAYLPGDRGVWEASDLAMPGHPVLLADPDGLLYLRLYEPRGRGNWAGISQRPGHRELTPAADGVRIVACMRLKYLG